MATTDLLKDTVFVKFCSDAGILTEVHNLIKQNTPESLSKLSLLISSTAPSKDLFDEIERQENPPTIIIGNGDVQNYDDGITKAKESGVDGVMIGRGIFKDPWAFLPEYTSDIFDTKERRIELLMEHLISWQVTWGETKNFAAMKKFVKMYINGFEDASSLRAQFMELTEAGDMVALCREQLRSLTKSSS